MPHTERGLKDGRVSKGVVNQGYTGCYKEVNGIVVDPAVDNSDNLFVNLSVTLFHGTLANMTMF